MNNSSYPEEYEIKEVCSNFIKRRILNAFMQERGVFAINATAEDIGKILSHCVWERISIEELRTNAYQLSTKSSLSGFVMRSSSTLFSLNDIYEKARDNNRALLSKGYKLGKLVVESRNDVSIYKGRLDYEIRKPGRIQFMEKEQSHCDFFMFENKKGEWQVEVDCTRSADGKEVQKLFSQLVDKETTKISSLNIDNLSDKQTIEFFDTLIDDGMTDDWRFEDVIALTFRRGRESEDEEENVDDDSTQETKNTTILSGIRQAILEGGGLRENAFVKQFEENGCIFTAMTFEFSHKTIPEVIYIRAEFRGSPKVFEVSIVDFFERTGPNAKCEVSSLPLKKNLEIRSAFWNQARRIFTKVVSEKNDN